MTRQLWTNGWASWTYVCLWRPLFIGHAPFDTAGYIRLQRPWLQESAHAVADTESA